MGRKFKMREGAGFVFMSQGRPIFGKNIVDEDDPDFKVQAHKFDPIPVDDTVAEATVSKQVATVLAADLAGLEAMKRPDMVKLFTRIAGEAPPDGITVGELRGVLVLVRDAGATAAEALEEVCGKSNASGAGV